MLAYQIASRGMDSRIPQALLAPATLTASFLAGLMAAALVATVAVIIAIALGYWWRHHRQKALENAVEEE